MKIYIALLFLTCINYFYGQSQKDTLYGNIKSVKVDMIFLDKSNNIYRTDRLGSIYGEFGVITSERYLKSTLKYWYNTDNAPYLNYIRHYNTLNKPIQDIWYDIENNVEAEFKYTYDKNGNKIQQKKIYGQNEFISRNYYYNRKTNLLESSIFFDSQSHDNYSYSRNFYDDQGNMVLIEKFNNHGQITKYKYVYKSGNKIKSMYNPMRVWVDISDKRKTSKKDSVGFDYIIKEFNYDEYGNIIDELSYNDGYNESVFIHKKSYNYNSSNLITKEMSYKYRSKDSVQIVKDYIYNKDGQLITKIYTDTKRQSKNKTTNYRYNKAGHIHESTIKKQHETIRIQFKYKFDKYNNWVKQTKIVNGIPLFIWKRDIEYF